MNGTWEKRNGTFQSIAVGSDGVVCGLNNNKAYFYTGNDWENIPGDLSIKKVSVGNASNIWMITTDGNCYQYIGTGSKNLQSWKKIPGTLTDISVGADGAVWGIYEGNIYRYNGKSDNPWEGPLPGTLAQISVGSAEDVWGINSQGFIYRYTGDASFWKQMDGHSITNVSVAEDGIVYCVVQGGQVYLYNGLGVDSWELFPGTFDQISVGNAANIWGLYQGNVYQFVDPNRTTNPQVDTDFFSDALLCANLSNIAYEDNPSSFLSALGYNLYAIYEDKKTSTQAYLAYNQSSVPYSIALAFRGSWEFGDLNTDLWLEQVSLDQLGSSVKVLEGFNKAYESIEGGIMKDIPELINHLGGCPGMKMFITGHSLGGALAVYATVQVALLLQRFQEYTSIDSGPEIFDLQMISFGAPPVGNQGFSQFWNGLGNLFSGTLFVDPTDPVPTGNISGIVPGIKINLESLGYYNVAEKYTLPSGKGHPLSNYIELITQLKGRNPKRLSSLSVYITTGTGTVAPWYSPDKAGTDRDITFTIGSQNGPKQTYNLNNWGDDFEKGNTDEFTFSNPGYFSVDELRYFEVDIDVSSGVFTDNWMLDGVKIVADGITIYDKQNMQKLLGPDYSWSFTDIIPPS